MRSQEFTGKTTQEAIDAGLAAFGVTIADVHVDVIQEGAKGLFGLFGSKPARVRMTVMEEEREDDHGLSDLLGSFSLNEQQPQRKKKPAAPKQEAPKAEAPKAERRNEQPKKQPKPRQEKKPQPKAEPVVKEYAPAAEGSVEERIEVFIKGLLEHMGSDAVPHAWKGGDDTYQVDLVGENLGMLIGRRGETLDAIQHLTNYTINRDSNKRSRINVDAENYRLKREDSLRRLAMKVAGKVVKYRRNITLEPMNAYERHVIHATLQDVPDVTTYSTGTEPNRRVVVSYSKYSQNG